jgi:uncharacterized protein with gpF-like domain
MASAIAEVIRLHRAQIQGVIELRGVVKLRGIYEKSRAELEAKLAKLRRQGKGDTFTAQHMRMVLVQVNDGIHAFQEAMGEHLTKEGKLASVLAQRHLIKTVEVAERQFTGHTPVLETDRAAILRGVREDITPSLLDRYEASKGYYGAQTIEQVKGAMAESLVQGETVDGVVSRIAASGGVFDGQRWRADRIARTELAYTYGASTQATMETMRDRDLPGLMKRLVATFDSRTGEDSEQLDGQTVPVDEPFIWERETKHGTEVVEYFFPPNRPQDRECVIPWSGEWNAKSIGSQGEVTPKGPSVDIEESYEE